ncbi:MAG: hypothetical protein GY697_22465 [Desulfobacterales bacterium]|nr:hypothetical protein [Desulfobacterales bacterium]
MQFPENTSQVHSFISRNEIWMDETPAGLRIRCREGIYEAAPGAPALPRRLLRIALPEGCQAVSVTAKIRRTIDMTDRFTMVRPMPQSIVTTSPDGRSVSESRLGAPDEKAYGKVYGADAAEMFRLVATEGHGVVPVALVSVPVVGMTREGIVELYADVEVTVSYEELKQPSGPDKPLRVYRQYDVLENVVNPDQVDIQWFEARKSSGASAGSTEFTPDPMIPDVHFSDLPDVPTDIDYLIITDNLKWNAHKIEPGNSTDSGSLTMRDAFKKLADHKKQRGYRVHVARVVHIVGGYYGDFRTGARDLPELLRNFLKDFCPRHGVEWVLLGGDIDIIPVRHAVITGGPWQLPFKTVTSEIHKDYHGHVEFKGDYLAMRVDKTKLGAIPDLFENPDGPSIYRQELTLLNSGRRVMYNDTAPVGKTGLRWFHTTDSTFQNISLVATQWIRVEGPPEVINSQAMWYVFANRIPTDLYYASLHGSDYSLPGKHDWDLNDNEIYGQWNAVENCDGIAYSTSVGLGRAPVRTADEATVFCDKVIAYELAPERPSEQQRFREITYAAEHVDRSYRRISKFQLGMGFNADYYFSYPNYGMATIHADVLANGVIDTVVSYVDENTWRELPYDVNAGPTKPGWFYANGLADDTPSVTAPIFNFLPGSPLPTEYITVYSDQPAELEPLHFILDGYALDAAIQDTHELATQMYQDFPLVDKRLCLYTDIPDLPWTAGTGVPATYRLLTHDTLRNALQQGPHFVSLNGHGNPGGCCHMNNVFINALGNGPKQFVVWAVSCDTARMEDFNSFGKLMVKKQGGGAVAYVGFTRSSIGYPGPKCRLAFFDRLRTTRHLARLHDARLSMWPVDWVHRFDILSCTLYGDPEMPVYRDHRDAQPLFIGNRRSKELHEDRCPWAKLITRKIHFYSVAEGLSHGYDGCGFCLREHHTR